MDPIPGLTTNPKTIILKGTNGRYEEGRADGVITPGQLIKRTADNGCAVQTASDNLEIAVAREDSLQGRTIDDNYAAEDLVGIYIPVPGDELYMVLEPGEDITEGDLLQSAGNGNVEVAASTNRRVAVAMESVDNSETGAVAARIKARVL